MSSCPELEPAAPLQFVINSAAAGSSDAGAKREVIESALRAGGRRGDLLFCSPAELSGVAHQAASKAIADRTAVVAVGGDGTLNTVAQAAHAVGCAMGVVAGARIHPQATARSSSGTSRLTTGPLFASISARSGRPGHEARDNAAHPRRRTRLRGCRSPGRCADDSAVSRFEFPES